MGLQSLCVKIKNIMTPRRQMQATMLGQITGSKVLARGLYYNYTTAVDIDVENGDMVWVVLDDTGTRAVVVGK